MKFDTEVPSLVLYYSITIVILTRYRMPFCLSLTAPHIVYKKKVSQVSASSEFQFVSLSSPRKHKENASCQTNRSGDISDV